MDYVKYISSFQQFARLGLERMERLTFHLGNPQEGLNVIHVAGTNGKGSVCAVLYSVLAAAGYRVGKYISPELDKVNERMSVCGVDISDEELEGLLGEIQPVVEKVNIEMGEMPSRFEVSTAAAFKFFAAKKCDYVILETGLGGRLDATNICKKPLVTVITTVDIDHAEYLGDTTQKIAFEKAGIIKEGVPCVSAPQLVGAMAVISTTCRRRKSLLIYANMRKVRYDGFDGMNERFGYRLRDGLKCGLAGVHQVVNSVVALDVVDVLRTNYGIEIDDSAVVEGVAAARNKARMELLCDKPYIIFDGAHNVSGAKALAQSLERYFGGRKFCFVVAMMGDKDCKGMIGALGGVASRFIATEVPENPRSMAAEELYRVISGLGFEAVCEKDLGKAIGKLDVDTVICGSLYYYKFVKEIVNKRLTNGL